MKALQEGKTVKCRPHGNSMSGKIESGQLCTLEPTTLQDTVVGDIVLCKVKGKAMIHLVTAVGDKGKVLISNNKGHDNGWTRQVYGKVTEVED
jgi:phage repressor protein C with HTH and peptisase S24 domain